MVINAEIFLMVSTAWQVCIYLNSIPSITKYTAYVEWVGIAYSLDRQQMKFYVKFFTTIL